jgi:hypothetical protein
MTEEPDPQPTERLSFAEHLWLLAYIEAGSVRREGSRVSVFTFWADPAHQAALAKFDAFGFITVSKSGMYGLTERGLAHLNLNFGSRNKERFTLPEPEEEA